MTREIMKKLFKKLHRKEAPSSRITSDTIAEHRQRILAGGRRFKYPVQYARHRLVFNAILISLGALIVAGGVVWQQLYVAQNTSTFMYRLTKVLPLPVASVDGQAVPYSDYLMKYLSSVHYLQQKEQVNPKTDDGKRQVAFIKQKSIEDAIADAYATKLATEQKITVSDSELEAFLKTQRQSSDGEISQQTYDAVILDYYGWTPDEYRHATKEKLLLQKVAYAVDKNATSQVATIQKAMSDPSVNFQTLVTTLNGQGLTKITYGTSGMVPKTNQDGGLAQTASKLAKNQISSVITSTAGDGYYFVRLLDSTSSTVSYEFIQIPLSTFTDNLAKLNATTKVKQFISIPKTTTN